MNATDGVVSHSASIREEVDRLLEDPSYKFEDQLEKNKNMLDDLDNRISETSRSIVDINEIVSCNSQLSSWRLLVGTVPGIPF